MSKEHVSNLRDLRDAAFISALKQRRQPTGPVTARRLLAERFPDMGEENSPLIWGVLDQAVALVRRAEELAELHRQQILDQATAIQRLSAQFPGFSEDTYRAAFGEGLFSTR